MFTNLRMVNFKSWKDTGDVRLAPLTVLFGGNSTGKSGLLQMLLLLKQTTESSDWNQVLQTGTDYPRSFVELGTPREITHLDEKEMGFTIEWDWPEWEHENRPLSFTKPGDSKETAIRSLTLEMKIWTAERPAFPSLISYSQGRGEAEKLRAWVIQYVGNAYPYGYDTGIVVGKDTIESGVNGPTHGVQLTKCFRFPAVAKDMISSTLPSPAWSATHPNASLLLDEIEFKFEEQIRRLHYLGPMREFPRRVYTWAGDPPGDIGRRGERAVSALLAEDLNSQVFAHLKQMGMAESFQVRPVVDGSDLYRVHVQRHAASHEVLLPDVGFGVSQVLPVLVQCLYAPEHSTIILEHPDLHLHPSAQAALADFLVDVTQQRKLQLIVESHSEHLLRRLQRRAAEDKLHPDEVALYFCDIQDGVSCLTTLEFDEFGQISNWPDGFFGDMTGDVIASLESSLERQIADG